VPSVRALIVSSDRLTRDGLASLLREDPIVDVLPPVDEESAAASIQTEEPVDVILWDFGWRPDDALEAVQALPGSTPPLVALTADPSHATLARNAGMTAILPRSASADALRAALLAALAGLVVRDPSFEHEASQPRDRLESGESLTPRELEVLQLLAEGLANKTIARRLGIRETTVKFHVNSILAKLGAQSRTEAVARAARQGLIFF
jgi:DNA-binding NarL/FixJ family response regulator